MSLKEPIRLFPIFRERVWGRESLAPFFSDAELAANDLRGKRVGEVWFTYEENPTSAGTNLGPLLKSHPEILGSAADPRHPGICPILVKLLFTTERLSVQVHPDDSYAQKHHHSLGKTEAWYVMDAQPPGELAVGFREALSTERFKRTIETGEIEELLDWRKVNPGDVVFTPAGTVHAIGAGLTICEIQENSDITYRLYDYGRPRELHIEHGATVSHLGPHEYKPETIHLAPWRDELVTSLYFRIERLRPSSHFSIQQDQPFYQILICLEGTGTVRGEPFRPGGAWLIPAGNREVSIEGSGSEWILTYAAGQPATGLLGS